MSTLLLAAVLTCTTTGGHRFKVDAERTTIWFGPHRGALPADGRVRVPFLGTFHFIFNPNQQPLAFELRKFRGQRLVDTTEGACR